MILGRVVVLTACAAMLVACSDEAPRALDAPRVEGSATPVTEAPPPPTASVAAPAPAGFLVPAQAGESFVPSDCLSADSGSAQDGLWVASLTTSSGEGITYDLACFEDGVVTNDTFTTRTNTFAPEAVAFVDGTEITIAMWVEAGLEGRDHWFAINGGAITAIELIQE
ncbi:MAG: hypothetical protein AAFZ07_29135 [Actinomycetota bacterium]